MPHSTEPSRREQLPSRRDVLRRGAGVTAAAALGGAAVGSLSALATPDTAHAATSWGKGPRSQFPHYWIGTRFLATNTDVDAPTWTAQPYESASMLNRPMDLYTIFSPWSAGPDAAAGVDAGMDYIAGGAVEQVGQPGYIGGILTGSQSMKVPWGNWGRSKSFLITVPLACKANRNKPAGSNSRLYTALSGREYNVYWGRLGAKMAYLDHTGGRTHSATVRTILELGWEIDSAQDWSAFNSSDADGRKQALLIPDALEVVVTAIRTGYEEYTGWPGGVSQRCPYLFSTRARPFCPDPAATGHTMKDILAGRLQGGFLDLIGVSAHDNKDGLTSLLSEPGRPRRNRIGAAGLKDFEGWDSYAEIARDHGLKLMLPETASHFYAEGSIPAGGPCPDQFLQDLHTFFTDPGVLPHVAGWTYFHESSTSLVGIGKPAESGRWEQTRAKYIDIWGA